MPVRLAALFVCGVWVMSGAQLSSGSNHCPPDLSGEKKTQLIRYVGQKYKLPETVKLTLTADKVIGETCYRELMFDGRSALKTWQLTLFLSPDQRFLTEQLFDTTLDPVEEERRKLDGLMAGLVQNKGTSKGDDNAPVTIVEFSDFECPFCRKLAEIMDQVLVTQKDRVRIVFHHLPLSMHAWAPVSGRRCRLCSVTK
jgi:Thioredoxin